MPSLTPYTSLPYSKHPLYKLRLTTLLTILLGSIFHLVAIVQGPFFGLSLFFLAVSALYILYDLLTWAVEKRKTILVNAHRQYRRIVRTLPPSNCGPFGCLRCPRGNPVEHAEPANPVIERGGPHGHSAPEDDDDEVHWPRLILLIADAVLAVVFQWLFWCCLMFVLNRGYYYNPTGVLVWQAYAALVDLVMSVLHAVAWWKELLARKREEWRREERGKTMASGGQELDVDVEAVAAEASSEEDGLVAPTPEETSPTDKGYGTLDASVQSLGGEPDVVVKKGKGKKVVGKGWVGGDANATAA